MPPHEKKLSNLPPDTYSLEEARRLVRDDMKPVLRWLQDNLPIAITPTVHVVGKDIDQIMVKGLANVQVLTGKFPGTDLLSDFSGGRLEKLIANIREDIEAQKNPGHKTGI